MGRFDAPQRRRAAVAAVLVALSVSVLCLAGRAGGLLASVDARVHDALQPGLAGPGPVVLVGIDDRSLAAVPEPWPWSRGVHAELVERLASSGASAVLLDVLFVDEGRGDEELAAAMASVPTVLPSSLELRRSPGLPVAGDELRPTERLSAAAAAVGHGNVTVDAASGVVRSHPLVALDERGVPLPSVVAATVLVADGGPGTVLVRDGAVQLDDRLVPLVGGELRTNLADRLTASAAVPAVDVLDGRVDPAQFDGAVVVVGATSRTLGDRFTTPLRSLDTQPGAVLHAAALATVLGDGYLVPAPTVGEVAAVVALALLCAGVATRRRTRVVVPVVLGSLLAVVALAAVRFGAGELWGVAWPGLAAVLGAVGGVAWRARDERDRRAEAVKMVGQYVPTPVARALLRDGPGSLPTGRVVLVMTDVVGSTALWERDPASMRTAMVRHDALVDAAVEGAGGALVRPRGEGDSRFAVFLDPGAAVDAALALHAAVAAEVWSTPEPLRLRTGVHLGDAELRAGDYYGPEVNRAARIRGVASPGQVVVSEEVRRWLGPGVATRSLGPQQLKGVEERIEVHVVEPAA